MMIIGSAAYASFILDEDEVLLDPVHFHEHGLYLDIIILPHVHEIVLKLVDLPVFPLLPLDKQDGVGEPLLLQVVHILLPQHLDLAAMVKVGALHQLELTLVSVTVNVLSLDSVAAFVFAFDDLKEAALIVRGEVLIHNDRVALLVRTVDLTVITCYFMRLHFFSFKPCLTAFFEEAVSFIGTVNDLKGTIDVDVFVHVSPFNQPAALILARYNSLGTVVGYVVLHVIQW